MKQEIGSLQSKSSRVSLSSSQPFVVENNHYGFHGAQRRSFIHECLRNTMEELVKGNFRSKSFVEIFFLLVPLVVKGRIYGDKFAFYAFFFLFWRKFKKWILTWNYAVEREKSLVRVLIGTPTCTINLISRSKKEIFSKP